MYRPSVSYRCGLLSATLAILLLAFGLNAYACLVPIHGGVTTAQGSGCSSPHEQTARQFCDAFKTFGIQEASAFPSPQDTPFLSTPAALRISDLAPDPFLFSPVESGPLPGLLLDRFVTTIVLRL